MIYIACFDEYHGQGSTIQKAWEELRSYVDEIVRELRMIEQTSLKLKGK